MGVGAGPLWLLHVEYSGEWHDASRYNRCFFFSVLSCIVIWQVRGSSEEYRVQVAFLEALVQRGGVGSRQRPKGVRYQRPGGAGEVQLR